MSNLSDRQALALAKQIKTRFGRRLADACRGTVVEPAFLAGLIANEAGKNRQGWIVETATRFEPAVYADLVSLRDNGYCYIAGKKRTTYSGVKREQILDATDDALRALATSYGLTQIMGWHGLASLDCTVAELRDPDKHLGYAVKLAQIVAKPQLSKAQTTKTETVRLAELEKALRIWNTGRPTGKTYHASYVPNGLAVRKAYLGLADNPPSATPAPDPDLQRVASKDPDPALAPAVPAPAVEVTEPAPTGFIGKLKAFIASLLGGTTLLAFAEKFGSVTVSTSILVVICLIIFLAFAGFVVWYVVDSWKQAQRVRLEAEINTDPNRKDLHFVK